MRMNKHQFKVWWAQYWAREQKKRGSLPDIVVTTSPFAITGAHNGRRVVMNVAADNEFIFSGSYQPGFQVTLQTKTYWPTKMSEGSGVAITDDRGWRFSNPYGRGRNMIQRPNKNVIVKATALNTLAASGAIAKWQSCTDRTAYNDSYNIAAGLRQACTRSLHTAYGASGEDAIVAVQFIHIGAWGLSEGALTNTISIRNSIEYPLGVPPTKRATWTAANSIDGILTSGQRLRSNTYFVDTPIPLNAQFACWTWQGTDTGSLILGKGMSIPNVDGEMFRYGNSGGASNPTEDRTLTAVVGASTQTNATIGYRPIAIIAITRNGAKIMIGTSKDQPSNGDYPTKGAASNNRRAGLAERLYGGNCATLNLACSADTMNSFRQSTGALRRALMEFGDDIVINGYGPNDIGATSDADFINRFTLFRAMPEMQGRSNDMYTISPYNVTTAPTYYVLESDQGVGNAAWETRRRSVNNLMRTGQFPPATSIKDVAAVEESTAYPGAYKAPPGARIATGGGSITAGTNTYVDTNANFTLADDNFKIVIAGAGASGAILYGRMKYVNSTTVTLFNTVSGAVLNAGTTVSTATAYIKARWGTEDGTHETPEMGLTVQTALG